MKGLARQINVIYFFNSLFSILFYRVAVCFSSLLWFFSIASLLLYLVFSFRLFTLSTRFIYRNLSSLIFYSFFVPFLYTLYFIQSFLSCFPSIFSCYLSHLILRRCHLVLFVLMLSLICMKVEFLFSSPIFFFLYISPLNNCKIFCDIFFYLACYCFLHFWFRICFDPIHPIFISFLSNILSFNLHFF